MRRFIIFLAIAASSCSSLPKNSAVRLDYQESQMTEDSLTDENDMETIRVSYQYWDEAVSSSNPVGPVPQIGISIGNSSQTADLGQGAFDFEVDQIQLDLGVRFYGSTKIQPFFGFGIAPTWTEFTDPNGSEDMLTVGGYVEAGVEVPVGENLRLGAGYRMFFEQEGTIQGQDVDVDSNALMFSLGWGF